MTRRANSIICVLIELCSTLEILLTVVCIILDQISLLHSAYKSRERRRNEKKRQKRKLEKLEFGDSSWNEREWTEREREYFEKKRDNQHRQAESSHQSTCDISPNTLNIHVICLFVRALLMCCYGTGRTRDVPPTDDILSTLYRSISDGS